VSAVDVINARMGAQRRSISMLEADIVDLKRQLKGVQVARGRAEANASRFHALLIAERIRHLTTPTQTNGRVGSPVRASADAATGG
jgi:hypothetical protein